MEACCRHWIKIKLIATFSLTILTFSHNWESEFISQNVEKIEELQDINSDNSNIFFSTEFIFHNCDFITQNCDLNLQL